MPAFYASLKRLEVYHLRNLLETEGIYCVIRNEALSQLAGEIPFTECMLELWLKRADDRPRAEDVLKDFRSGPAPAGNWRCICNETMEGQFTACWRCGSERPQPHK